MFFTFRTEGFNSPPGEYQSVLFGCILSDAGFIGVEVIIFREKASDIFLPVAPVSPLGDAIRLDYSLVTPAPDGIDMNVQESCNILNG